MKPYQKKKKVKLLSCVRLSETPMDCSLTGFSVHGIFQARVSEWFVISFSRGSSQVKDRMQVSRIVGRRFTLWATREAPTILTRELKKNKNGEKSRS